MMMMQSRQQRQAVQVIKRSVFEELGSILSTLKLSQQSELKTVERVLRQHNGAVIMCQERQQVCWSKVIRMPREHRDSRNITFKVVSNNRHGQSCIKIYSIPRQEELEVMEPQRRAVVKMVIRLPSQVSEQLEMRETRIGVTREGLVLVKVPLRIRCEQQRFHELLRQLPHNSIVVVKSRQQCVLHAEQDCLANRRSIFEELEHIIRRQQQQQDREPTCINNNNNSNNNINLQMLEQLLNARNNNNKCGQQEWTTFVPLQQQPQQQLVQQVIRNIIFRIKRNEQKGTQYIKIIGRKQLSDNNEKICIKVRVPLDFKPRQLRCARIQFTREGLVLIRVPRQHHDLKELVVKCNNITIQGEEKRRQCSLDNCLVQMKKQIVERSNTSIFEELSHLMKEHQRMSTSCCQEERLEQLEQLLRERDNFVRCHDRRELVHWTSIVSDPCEMKQEEEPKVTFKVSRWCSKDDAKTIITEVTVCFTRKCGVTGEKRQVKLVLRLPSCTNTSRRFDVQRTRVIRTHEGLVLIRVPMEETEEEKARRECFTTGGQLNHLLSNNFESQWSSAEEQRLQRQVLAVVRQRLTPIFEVCPRFTVNHCGERRVKLDIQMPPQLRVRAQDVGVKVQGPVVQLEIMGLQQICESTTSNTYCWGSIERPRCTLVMPHQVLVSQLKVTLSESGQLRFNFPVDIERPQMCCNNFNNSAIGDRTDQDKTMWMEQHHVEQQKHLLENIKVQKF